MKALKIGVIGMGVVIVVGLTVVIAKIVAESNAPRERADGPATARLNLPDGCAVAGMASAGRTGMKYRKSTCEPTSRTRLSCSTNNRAENLTTFSRTGLTTQMPCGGFVATPTPRQMILRG